MKSVKILSCENFPLCSTSSTVQGYTCHTLVEYSTVQESHTVHVYIYTYRHTNVQKETQASKHTDEIYTDILYSSKQTDRQADKHR